MNNKHLLLLLFLLISSSTFAAVSLTPPADMCANDDPVNLTTLTSASPSGGTWICTNSFGSFNPVGNDDITFNPSLRGPTVEYTYQLRYYTAGKTDSGDISIKVNRLPQLNISPAAYDLCVGESPVKLNALPPGGTWTGTGYTFGHFDPQAQGVIFGYNNLKYTYQDTNTGCINSDSFDIQVFDLHQANIATHPDTHCIGNPIELTALGKNAIQWGAKWTSLDGDMQANLQTHPFSPSLRYFPDSNDIKRGEITFIITTEPYGNCPTTADSATIYLETCLGIKSAKHINISVYPNPASSQITLSKGVTCSYTVQLISTDGKLLNTYNWATQQPLTIDISQMDKGIYFILLVDENGSQYYKKLVIN